MAVFRLSRVQLTARCEFWSASARSALCRDSRVTLPIDASSRGELEEPRRVDLCLRTRPDVERSGTASSRLVGTFASLQPAARRPFVQSSNRVDGNKLDELKRTTCRWSSNYFAPILRHLEAVLARRASSTSRFSIIRRQFDSSSHDRFQEVANLRLVVTIVCRPSNPRTRSLDSRIELQIIAIVLPTSTFSPAPTIAEQHHLITIGGVCSCETEPRLQVARQVGPSNFKVSPNSRMTCKVLLVFFAFSRLDVHKRPRPC